MNCPKCQALVPTGATVCPTCGEALPAAQPAKKKLPIPLIAGGAGALVVIIILIAVLAGSGAKGVLSNQFKAYDKEDGKYLFKNVPQLYIDAVNEELDDDDKKDEDDFIKEYDKTVDNAIDNREDDFKDKYKVIRTRKVKKDIVEQFNEYLDKDSSYNEVYDEKEHKITAAYIIEYRYEATEDGDYHYAYGEMVAIKEDGKWKNASLIDGGFDWENGIDEDEDKED
ncbi:MAG: hypothetical protein UHK54_02895 [Acutalibacteraceae bacterium]|nr:hypothetical protein [Acutalibacteraceae bacterium]